MKKSPALTVVTPTTVTTIKPSRKLGTHGMSLWKRVTDEFEISDAAGVELLTLACAALDRAEACREQIDHDGEVVRGKSGPREHPLIKAELSNRAFISRTLARLGLDAEPLRASRGRPARGFGWRPDDDEA